MWGLNIIYLNVAVCQWYVMQYFLIYNILSNSKVIFIRSRPNLLYYYNFYKGEEGWGDKNTDTETINEGGWNRQMNLAIRVSFYLIVLMQKAYNLSEGGF